MSLIDINVIIISMFFFSNLIYLFVFRLLEKLFGTGTIWIHVRFWVLQWSLFLIWKPNIFYFILFFFFKEIEQNYINTLAHIRTWGIRKSSVWSIDLYSYLFFLFPTTTNITTTRSLLGTNLGKIFFFFYLFLFFPSSMITIMFRDLSLIFSPLVHFLYLSISLAL